MISILVQIFLKSWQNASINDAAVSELYFFPRHRYRPVRGVSLPQLISFKRKRMLRIGKY